MVYQIRINVLTTHPKIEEKPDFGVCAAKPHTPQNPSSSNSRMGSKAGKITNIKKLAVEFVTVFAVALVTGVMVTLLWNIIWHAKSTIDWETAFLLAILFGIIQTRVKSREIKEKLKGLAHREKTFPVQFGWAARRVRLELELTQRNGPKATCTRTD
jgi:hypothetical protein